MKSFYVPYRWGKCPVKNIGCLTHQIGYFFERGFKGYSTDDAYNLDSYLLHVIIGGLKTLKKNSSGYPGNLNSIEEWHDILNEMIHNFEKVQFSMEEFKSWDTKEDLEEAMKLFSKHFLDLWD